MLRPSGDWYWYKDEESTRLAISLGKEMCFLTAYDDTCLTPLRDKPISFNVHHLEHYAVFADALDESPISMGPAEKTQVALNATAAVFFHQPVNPKSWLYRANQGGQEVTRFHNVETEFGTGLVMRIESHNDLHTCILLSRALGVSQRKTLAQFNLIKLQSDRLHAI